MKREQQTIIRTVLLVLALVNQILVILGYSPLPIEDEEITALISMGLTLVTSIWAWWKNNSITSEAQEADVFLDELKTAKGEPVGITEEEMEG